MHLRGLGRVRLRLPRNGHTSGQQVRFQGQCLCVCVCARAREQMRGWQGQGWRRKMHTSREEAMTLGCFCFVFFRV